MRAVIIGLSLALGLADAAEAAKCAIVGLPKKPLGIAGPVQRPDLAGQRFRVTRTTSQRKMTLVQSQGVERNLGYEAYELKGKAGTFIVQREYVAGTPAVTPLSFEKQPAGLRWVRRGPKVGVGDLVLDGPLAALEITEAACTR